MTRLAFLFPGQGAQRVGMGAALARTDADVLDAYLELAEDVACLPIRRLCREGPSRELTRTEACQPALLAVSLALAEVARDAGLRPAWVAGHSLGEYAAAVAADVLTPEDAMRLVVRRARLMADRQAACPGAMAAVIGLGASATAALCRAVAPEAGPVAVANINSDEQVVVSGARAAVDALAAVARSAGARVVLLPVGGAFHSPLMEPVSEEMSAVAAGIAFRDPVVPLVANVSGELLTDAASIRRALVAQISRPVRWTDSVRALAAAGCELFVELGAAVLTGLVRAIDPDAAAHGADSRSRLAALAAEGSGPTRPQASEDELLAAIGTLLRRLEPVPQGVLEAARLAPVTARPHRPRLALVDRDPR
jgi:[acyl-carrier-protein] S-malonyltransferase